MMPPKKTFLFGAVVGSGLTAQAADKAGADYLLALNAGRFRVQGASSLTSFLPVRSANDWVMEFAEREMLGRCSAPIYAGLSVSDPNLDIDELLARIKALGFAGVCNFPTTTSIDGRLGALFERQGLGFSREVALIEKALELDSLQCDDDCDCRKSLELAVWTAPETIDPKAKSALAPLFE